ncbi:MAG TPA: hypothetical protein VF264_06020 [Rhodanobacteraceae bacterium]
MAALLTTGATATATFDAGGNPLDAGQATMLANAQAALACSAAPVAANLRLFMAQAGTPIPPAAPNDDSINGVIRTEVSNECALAMAGLGLAAAGMIVAGGESVASAGLGSPGLLWAWAGYVWASDDYYHHCEIR